jgi:hypothetical protein
MLKLVICLLASASLWEVTAAAQTNRIPFNGRNLFLNGANIAWRHYGNDVGPNARPDMDYFNHIFSQVRANGGNCLRLWVHIHGGNTPAWNGNTVTGPGVNTIRDLKRILDCAWTNQVGLILCLWSFDMLQAKFNTEFPGLTTRAYAILTNDTCRGDYITNALIPMVKGLKGHPAIVGWEIFNEPEGMTPQFGWSSYRVDISYVQKFINQCAGAIHRADPAAKVSNGAWSLYAATDVTLPGSSRPNNFNYYRDDRLIAAGGDPDGTLDFYMVHYYDWAGGANRSPFQHDAATWGLTKPLVVSEFSFFGCTNCGTNLHIALHDRGYAGALDWSFTDESPTAILDQIAGMAKAYPADVLVDTNGQVRR